MKVLPRRVPDQHAVAVDDSLPRGRYPSRASRLGISVPLTCALTVAEWWAFGVRGTCRLAHGGNPVLRLPVQHSQRSAH